MSSRTEYSTELFELLSHYVLRYIPSTLFHHQCDDAYINYNPNFCCRAENSASLTLNILRREFDSRVVSQDARKTDSLAQLVSLDTLK